MLPFQGYYVLESHSDQNRDQPSLVNVMLDGGESIFSSTSKTTSGEELRKSTPQPPCRSHKEAERRRRQRINSHLSTLRSLLPNTTKTDKASLLAEVVHHVKELSKQAAEAAAQGGSETEQDWQYPGESDEATLVSYFDGEAKMTRVSICCEDRPGLNRELAQAMKSVRAKVVRAEIVTVGGRTRRVVVMQWAGGSGGDEDVAVLENAMMAVVENRISGHGLGQGVRHNKRVRVFSLPSGGSDTVGFF